MSTMMKTRWETDAVDAKRTRSTTAAGAKDRAKSEAFGDLRSGMIRLDPPPRYFKTGSQ